MQAVVTTIWRGITWFFTGFQRVISSLWDGIASAFLWVAEWLAMFMANLMTALIEIVFKFASDVFADQSTEIDRMQKMLAAISPDARRP